LPVQASPPSKKNLSAPQAIKAVVRPTGVRLVLRDLAAAAIPSKSRALGLCEPAGHWPRLCAGCDDRKRARGWRRNLRRAAPGGPEFDPLCADDAPASVSNYLARTGSGRRAEGIGTTEPPTGMPACDASSSRVCGLTAAARARRPDVHSHLSVAHKPCGELTCGQNW
jgi:hypothetical protein